MQPLLVAGYLGREKFQGDLAIKLRVAGEIYFAHPALTQLGTNFVATEFCACRNHFNLIESRLLACFSEKHNFSAHKSAAAICEQVFVQDSYHFGFSDEIQFITRRRDSSAGRKRDTPRPCRLCG